MIPSQPRLRASRVVLALAVGIAGHSLPGRAPVVAGQAIGDQSLSSLETARVERMLESRVACLGCHQIDGAGGRIGPSLDGLSARSDFAYVLGVIQDPSGLGPATTMPHQAMPRMEAERLAHFLLSLEPNISTPGPMPEAPPLLAASDRLDGGALYARHCAACHGNQGGGDGWNAPALPISPTTHDDPALMGRRPDDTLFDAIYRGGYVLDKSARMPAFGAMLEPGQIRALVGYIRELCGCSQPAWAGGS
jgi:cytochrome c oxidase cbb3-type subunit III